MTGGKVTGGKLVAPIVVRSDAGRLVVQAGAGCVPVLGVLFLAAFGILAYGLAGGFTNLDEVGLFERAIGWVVALGGLWAGLWVIHTTRGHRTVFDPVRRTVVIERRAPFHTARQELRLAEVRRATVSVDKDSDGDPVYGIALELGGGRRASLTPQLYPDRTACDRAVAELNRFLDTQR